MVVKRAKAVLLLWSGDQLRVAMAPVNPRNRHAYKLAYSQRGSGAQVTAKSFLNWIGFDVSHPDLLTVDAVWNRKEGILEFEIPGPMSARYLDWKRGFKFSFGTRHPCPT